MKRLAILSLFVPALALAQPKTPEDFYKEGENQYTLGNFKAAADAFKKGFELEPDASKKTAYVFNIAQSYRQDKDCEKQVFFYKRYLSLKANDTKKPLTPQKRTEVEGWIAEGEKCVENQNSLSSKKPDGTTKPDGDAPDVAKPDQQVAVVPPPGDTDGDGDGDGDGDVTKSMPLENTKPHVVSLRLVGGASKLGMGDIDVGVRGGGTLLAGYPLAINDNLILDLGAGFGYTPIPYDRMDGTHGTASLSRVFANVAATYLVTPKIGIRADIGAGALVFSGVDRSPFTMDNPVSGGLAMFHLRVGLSADYAVTPNFIVTLAPIAFGYSPPKDGLDDSIDSITSIDFMAGVGYRM